MCFILNHFYHYLHVASVGISNIEHVHVPMLITQDRVMSGNLKLGELQRPSSQLP